MKTAGEVLRQARKERGWGLGQVAKETKIREAFLQALEDNDYTLLPSATSARCFLKNYAEYLDLPAESVLALFRRDHQKEGRQGIPVGWREAMDRSGVSWRDSGQRLLAVGVLIGVLFYLGQQYFRLARGPFLEVQYPQEGEEVVLEKIEVAGRADRDALVTVNDHLVALNQQGEFRYLLDLFSGENQITIKAESRNGQESVKQVKVFHLDK